jgi:acetyltransferase
VGSFIKEHSTKSAEIALLVTDQFQLQGLGTQLLRQLIEVGRDEQLQRLTGDILAENQRMQEICQKLSFRLQYSLEDQAVQVELEL